MTLYLIGIGGSGAKCIEAVLHLAAVGLLTDAPIKILFVDGDESNGNVERARNSWKIYQECYNLLERQNIPWMKTPIDSFDLWSPLENLGNSKTLESLFGYHNLKEKNLAIANLFDILYTKDEQQIPLDSGFKGRPALGAVIMSRVSLDKDNIWGTILDEIEQEQSQAKHPQIFFFGSVFGGTGGSVLPTLARLIANKLPNVKMGGVFLLPYFKFSAPAYIAPNAIYARPELFLLNTETSLRYYVTQAQKVFDSIYLLGNPNLSPVTFSLGQHPQRNPSHLLELYSALALRQFLYNPPPEKGTVVLISRRKTGELTWNDLPESESIKSALIQGTRFAYVWLNHIIPALEMARKVGIQRFQRLAPWFSEFFQPSLGSVGRRLIPSRVQDLPDFNGAKEQEAITIVSKWCQTYNLWLSQLHQWDGENVQLFRYQMLIPDDRHSETQGLSDLLIEDGRDKYAKSQDTVQELKASLLGNLSSHRFDRGTVGLAQALYRNCRL